MNMEGNYIFIILIHSPLWNLFCHLFNEKSSVQFEFSSSNVYFLIELYITTGKLRAQKGQTSVPCSVRLLYRYVRGCGRPV